MKRYLSIGAGAPARLDALRKENPADWRAARACGFDTWHAYCGGLSQGCNGDVPVWYAHTGAEFRKEQFADECEDAPRAVRDCKGWYTGCEDARATYRGIVARLPHGRFIVGYYSSDNGERVYLPEIYTEEREAATAADDHARIYAERESDYQARWSAAERLRDQREEAERRLRELLALRHDPDFPYARDEALGCLERIRKASRELATLNARNV